MQEENIACKESMRKRDLKIGEMRKRGSQLLKIVVSGIRSGALEGIDNIDEIDISCEEFESSEDSIEQRQQSSQSNQAGRLSTRGGNKKDREGSA